MTNTLSPPTVETHHDFAQPRVVTPLRVLLSLAVFLLAGGTLTITSLALFTDTASLDNNTFTTGDVDISAAPANAVVSADAMVPGDQDTAPLTVSNDGSLDLRYAIESTTTENTLAAELVLTIKSGVSVCDDANWGATGSTLYSGPLGSTAGDAIVGSAAAGDDAGDRFLAAGAAEVLCVNVTLPLASSVGEGESTTASLEFLAEQTSNNP
ncbi:MAG: TasA family protein [Ilumatobacter sp.]